MKMSSPVKVKPTSLRRVPDLMASAAMIQPGRPSFGPLQQIVDARLADVGTRALEQQGGFQRSHGQIFGADLHDPALGAQPCRWQRHVGAGGERELPAGREAQGELGDREQALLVRHRLGMVEQHGDGRLHRGDGGHEPGDRGDAGARGGQCPEDRRVDRLDPVQRNGKRAQQHDRVVVPVVAGDPGHARADSLGPLRHERGLAIPGRGDHGDDRRLARRPAGRPGPSARRSRDGPPGGGTSTRAARSRASAPPGDDRQRPRKAHP